MNPKKETVLILENIRSAENVGSMFRTADAAGVSRVYLIGITPAPIDRFGRPRKDVAKSALGAEKSVPWESVSFAEYHEFLALLAVKGFQILALEQSGSSLDYKKFKPKNKMALIVGSEVSGVSGDTLGAADAILEIPMRGEKESLNVAVATGIALYRLLDI